MYKSSDNSDVMKSIEGFDVFNSSVINKSSQLRNPDIYTISVNEGRLDLITRMRYFNYDYYGLIGIINRISDISDLSIGTEIILPAIEQLRSLFGD